MSIVKFDRVGDQLRDASNQLNDKDGSPCQFNASSPSKEVLEDEILNLRNKMEQAVWQEQSLTSDIVVQLSSMLDRKINEYMRIKLKKS